MTEPKTIEVESCEKCPTKYADEWGNFCSLVSPDREITYPPYIGDDPPPTWCPLREAPVMLRLKR